MSSGERRSRIRIAAAGDVHCDESRRAEVEAAFARLDRRVDLILLAGDLTTHGQPAEAAVLADACRPLTTPVVTVLGNHDWHSDRQDEIVERLRKAGVVVLEGDARTWETEAGEVGVVGAKGFVGGFRGSHLSNFGEPSLRALYRETEIEVDAIERGLRTIGGCAFRVLLLHYAPTVDTLAGEPVGIHAFLGTDRMAPPILTHEPDLVLHGHAHAGAPEGAVGPVPVYNVAVPVMGREFRIFELKRDGSPRPQVLSVA